MSHICNLQHDFTFTFKLVFHSWRGVGHTTGSDKRGDTVG